MLVNKEKLIDNFTKIIKCIIILLCLPIFAIFTSILISMILIFKLIGVSIKYIGEIFNYESFENVGSMILKSILFNVKYKDKEILVF